MNQEVKQKWITALRGGEYKQGRDALKTADNTFCCLGVLCDLYLQEGNPGEWKYVRGGINVRFYPDPTTLEGSNAAYLPESVQQWAGMDSDNGSMGTEYPLSTLNDAGKSFLEIADIIEQNL